MRDKEKAASDCETGAFGKITSNLDHRSLFANYQVPAWHGIRIYLAGKITKNGWRHRLTGYRGAVCEEVAFDPNCELVCEGKGFIFVGPFPVACDHGCWHGPSTHGAKLTNCSYFVKETQSDLRHRVFLLNQHRIRRSDGVFAYIDELDCCGTLAEIGYAPALGKPIGLAYGRNITVHDRNHLWFVEKCASEVYEAMPLEEAFEEFRLGLWSGRVSRGGRHAKRS